MIVQTEQQVAKFWQRKQAQYWLLGGIILLAVALRFYRLGVWSFWIDEIYTLDRALSFNFTDLITTRRLFLPPTSTVLTHYIISALGTTEWTARIASNLIGIASIPLVYFLVRGLFSSAVGLITVLLLAISPWHLFWSQNARFYTALMLIYFLASLAFFAAIEKDRPIYILIGFFLSYLAVLERMTALFLGPVVVCYLLLLKILPVEKPPGLRMRNVLLIFLPIIVLGVVQGYEFATTGDFLFADILPFLGALNTSVLRLSASIAFRIGVPMLVLGAFVGFYLLSQGHRAGIFIFVSAVLPILLLLLLSIFAFTVDRYIFVTLPFWTILAAVGVKTLFVQTKGQVRLLVLGLLLLLMFDYLGNVLLYYEFRNGDRPDWRAVFNLLEQNEQEGDLVFSTRPELGAYYLADGVKKINDLDLEYISAADKRAWFVIDEATSVVDPNLYVWIVDNSVLMDVFDVYLPGKSLSIRLYLYDPTEAG